MAVLHHAGEIAIVPEAQIDKNGRLGNLRCINAYWCGASAPMEFKLAPKGAKFTLKLADGKTAIVTLDRKTGRAAVRINREFFVNAATVTISADCDYWFYTVERLQAFPKSASRTRFRADYGTFTAGTGSAVLGDAEAARLAEFGWLVTKVTAMAAQIVATAVEIMDGTYPVEGYREVIGFADAIQRSYPAICRGDPALRIELANGVFGIVGKPGDPETFGVHVADLLYFLIRATKLLPSAAAPVNARLTRCMAALGTDPPPGG